MARDKEHQSDVKAERHLVGRGHYSHPNMSRTKAKKKKKAPGKNICCVIATEIKQDQTH